MSLFPKSAGAQRTRVLLRTRRRETGKDFILRPVDFSFCSERGRISLEFEITKRILEEEIVKVETDAGTAWV